MKIIELLYNEFKDGAPTLSEFVEWLGGNSQLALVTELRKSQNWDMSCKYNNFLKQPLTLGMFIPVDEDRDLLKKPKNYEDWTKLKLGVHYDQDLSKYSEYQKAEEKVMFSGFKYEGKDDDFIYVLDTNINERLFWNIKEGKIDSDDPEKQFVSFLIGLPVTKNYFKHLD